MDLPLDSAEGAAVTAIDMDGSWPVLAEVVAQDGGVITAEYDPWGRLAFRFPTFSKSPEPARAVIRVTVLPESQVDPLAPGRADFTFGAAFSVDSESQGTVVDGGNNLIQRGLASDPSQYKIDVDDDRPSCRIEGSEGVVELRLSERVTPGVWYEARCTRLGELVEFSVLTLDGGSGTVVETVTAEAVTGDLQWTRSTPLSVGGKMSAHGLIIQTATDQFNGLASAPFFALGGSR